MPEIASHHSLSFGDALFLYLEREGAPINIAAVMIFEGKMTLARCKAFVELKLPLIPRWLQRVAMPPLNLGLPAWENDPTFDIDNHVREVTLKHGTDAELKALAGEIFSMRLNREHPLWDLTLVNGLEGKRTAVIARVHHCLADGVAGVGLINALMDTAPDAPKLPKRKKAFQPLQSVPQESLLESLVRSYSALVKQLVMANAELLNLAQGVVAGLGDSPFPELLHRMPELGAPADRLPFNTVCRGPQKFAWTELPIPEIKAIKNECGGTFNDVILAVVAATFRRYALLHDVPTAGRTIRIVVPVNVRGDGNAADLQNRITFVPVSLPLDIKNPRQLLADVSLRMNLIKKAHLGELVSLAGSVLAAIPTAFQALIGPIASQLPLSVCNSICTNVPGPQVPLYFYGHKLLRWYPYVPIGGEMGVNCAILTYDGQAFFGFTGDQQAAPDLCEFERFVQQSFAELREVVPSKVPKPQPSKPESKTGKPERPSGSRASQAHAEPKRKTPRRRPGKRIAKNAKTAKSVSAAQSEAATHPYAGAPEPLEEAAVSALLEPVLAIAGD